MKKILSVLTVLMIAFLFTGCQEDNDQIRNSSEINETPSGAFQQSNPIHQQFYLKVSEFLETNPVEGLLEREMNYHEWIMSQETIEPVTKQELLAVQNTISSLVYYTYNQDVNGWDVILLTAKDNGQVQVVKGDVLTLDALNFEVLPTNEKSPNYVLNKGTKKNPIDADKHGCTKRVCDDGFCHEYTFIPCKISKGLATCSTLGASCDSGTGIGGSLHDVIVNF